ncbi:unnamed protein product [Gordionus sp. m RMFG-2023]
MIDLFIFSESDTGKIYLYNTTIRSPTFSEVRILAPQPSLSIASLAAAYVFESRSDLSIKDYNILSHYKVKLFVGTNAPNPIIATMNLDESAYNIIRVFHDQQAKISSINVDPFSGLLYYVNNLPNKSTINVMNLRGLHHKELVKIEGENKIMSMKVTPKFGYMFWTNLGKVPSIERANMDGSNRKILISSDILSPWGLTIFEQRSKIYWGDRKTYTIESVDFNGTDRYTIVNSKNTGNIMVQPYSLIRFRNRIFWADWGIGKIMKTSLLSGKKDSTGNKIFEVFGNVFDRPNSLIMLSDADRLFSKELSRYPCINQWKNNPCDQLCIPIPYNDNRLSSNGESSNWWKDLNTDKVCACQDGTKLNEEKYCEAPNKDSSNNKPARLGSDKTINDQEDHTKLLLIYDIGLNKILAVMKDLSYLTIINVKATNFVKSFYADKLTGVIYWIEYVSGSRQTAENDNKYQSPNHFYYIKKANMGFDNLSYVDTSKISMPTKITTLKKYNSLINELESLAIDYLSRTIYFTDSKLKTISVLHLDGYHEKVLITRKNSHPKFIEVDSEQGLIFWTEIHDFRHQIFSGWGDGSNIKVLALSNIKSISGFTLDSKASMVYWSDMENNIIEKISYDGTNRKSAVPTRGQQNTETSPRDVFQRFLIRPTSTANPYDYNVFRYHSIAIDDDSLYFTEIIRPYVYKVPKNAMPTQFMEDDENSKWHLGGPDILKAPNIIKVFTILTSRIKNGVIKRGSFYSSFADKSPCFDNSKTFYSDINAIPNPTCSHFCLLVPNVLAGLAYDSHRLTKVCECPDNLKKIKGPHNNVICGFGENATDNKSFIEISSTYIKNDVHDRKNAFRRLIEKKGVSFLYCVDMYVPGIYLMDPDDLNMYINILEPENYPAFHHEQLNNVSSKVTNILDTEDFSGDNKYGSIAPINVQYDHESEKFFFIDSHDNTIKSISVNQTNAYSLVVRFSSFTSKLTYIALDSYTNLIYYSDVQRKVIGVLTKDGSLNKDLINLSSSRAFATSIVVDSTNGFIYWTEWSSNKEGRIAQADMNGNNIKTLVREKIIQPLSLVLDINDELLYWIDVGKIWVCDVFGKNSRVLLAFDAKQNGNGDQFQPISLSVSQSSIYWTDKYAPLLYMLSKNWTPKKAEYGSSPKYVVSGSDSNDENTEINESFGNIAPERILRIGKEVKVQKTNSPFISVMSIRIFNVTLHSQAGHTDYLPRGKSPRLFPAYRNCPSSRLRRGTCSDFCFPLPYIDEENVNNTRLNLDQGFICGCATRPGFRTSSAIFLKGDRNGEMFYSYDFAQPAPTSGTSDSSWKYTSVLLEDKLTCNHSSKCYPKGYNLMKDYHTPMLPLDSGVRVTECDIGAIAGHTCKFECLPGFTSREGSYVRECLENGLWSGNPLVCQPIKCENLVSPMYSKIISCPGTFNSSCLFECDTEAIYDSGSLERICMKNGLWSGTALQCRPKNNKGSKGECHYPRLDFSNNAVVVKCPSSPRLGDLCEFKCNYPLVPHTGSSSVICTEGGTWSQHFLSCKAMSCPFPSTPFNAVQISCEDDPHHSVDSKCYYKCAPGFYRVHGHEVRLCMNNGEWSGQELLCSECKPLPKPSMGIMDCEHKGQVVVCDVKCDDGAILLSHDKESNKTVTDSATFYCDRYEARWYPPNTNSPSCTVLTQPRFVGLIGNISITRNIILPLQLEEFNADVLSTEHNEEQNLPALQIIDNNDLKKLCSDSTGLFRLDKHFNPLGDIDAEEMDNRCSKTSEYHCRIHHLYKTHIECHFIGSNSHITKASDKTRNALHNYDYDYLDKSETDEKNDQGSQEEHLENLVQFHFKFEFIMERKSGKDRLIDPLHTFGSDFSRKNIGTDLINALKESHKTKFNKTLAHNTARVDIRRVKVEIVCDYGHIKVGESCAGCPDGTMKMKGKCIQCPIGSYQDSYSQESCKPCLVNSFTSLKGSFHCQAFTDVNHSLGSALIGTRISRTTTGLIFLLSVIFFVVTILIIYFFVKNRKKKHPDITKIPLPFKFLNRNFTETSPEKTQKCNTENNNVNKNSYSNNNDLFAKDELSENMEVRGDKKLVNGIMNSIYLINGKKKFDECETDATFSSNSFRYRKFF